MHILIITPYYAPDLGPSAPLFTMLSVSLVQRGHQVTVITGVPQYPSGRVPPAFQGRWIQRSLENGVEVVRVLVPSVNRKKLTKRMLQFACFQIGATIAGLILKYDASIICNSALQSWLPFTWHVIFRRKPAIYSIHDVYPDVGVQLGIFQNKTVTRIVAGLEGFCANHAGIVRILSDSFRPGVQALGVENAKIAIIYDWVDTDLIRPIPKENSFSREHGLNDHFVILYAGNIGLSQGLEHILTTAEILSDHQDLRFVFVGDGAGRELLQTRAKQRQLRNVHFIPFQPRELLPEVLASADVSLVILRRGIGSGSLPSKTFSTMASGRPLLVSVDEDSDTWKLVNRAEAGICVPPEDPAKLAEAILSLKDNKPLRNQMGRNGREWAVLHHSPQMAAQKFEDIFYSILPGRSNNN